MISSQTQTSSNVNSIEKFMYKCSTKLPRTTYLRSVGPSNQMCPWFLIQNNFTFDIFIYYIEYIYYRGFSWTA